MPSGGARARSGPPPDPNSLRRDRDGKDWVHLPAAGREGDPPAWPLSKPKTREVALWLAEWKRPQAVEWDATDRVLEVALYVRNVVRAEKSSAPASVGTLLIRQQTELGLNLTGMRANRWIIDDELAEATAPVRTDDDRNSAKARLRTISGGVAS